MARRRNLEPPYEIREANAGQTICPLTRTGKSFRGKPCVGSACALWRRTARLAEWVRNPPQVGDPWHFVPLGFCGLASKR